MKKNIELFIALKYLKGREKSIFALFSTVIGIAGIGLGVAALIVTLGVMNGFHFDIREKILGLNPHLIVLGQDITDTESVTKRLKLVGGLESIAPFVYGQVVIKTKYSACGVLLKGIEFDSEKEIVPLEKISITGEWANMESDDIVLGKELVKNLGINLGDELIVVSPSEYDFTSMSIPRMNKFKLAGIFNSGIYDYDVNLAYINLNKARDIFSLKGVSGFGIKLKNIGRTDSIAKKIRNILSYRVITWQELNRNLFAALRLEKTVMFLLLALIIVVACFNIISNLLLLGIEKAKEIGIFSAIGMKMSSVRKIFIYEGLITGLLGTSFGAAFGILLSAILKRYQFVKLPPEIYYVDKLPVRLSFIDIAVVVFVAMVVTILSSIYPANRASKLNPVDIIRYG